MTDTATATPTTEYVGVKSHRADRCRSDFLEDTQRGTAGEPLSDRVRVFLKKITSTGRP